MDKGHSYNLAQVVGDFAYEYSKWFCNYKIHMLGGLSGSTLIYVHPNGTWEPKWKHL
jgi:hypothetical protein